MAGREEFRCSNFGLNHSEPHAFVKAQWGSDVFYVVWRVFWTIFHCSWIVASGVQIQTKASSEANQIKWFVYLTNWSYLLLTIDVSVQCLVVIYVHCQRKDIRKGILDSMPWFLKLEWILYNVSTTASILVTVLFWGLLFPGIGHFSAVTFDVHAVNSIYVIVNLAVTRIPVRLFHFYQPMIYGFVYISFSAIYQSLGGTDIRDKPAIYPVLDWNQKPTTAIIVTVVSNLVVVPVIHSLIFLVQLLRRCFHRKISRPYSVEVHIPMDAKSNASSTDVELKHYDNNAFTSLNI